MAWTAPRTWVTGEVVTAAIMNLHLRDNLTFLGASHDHGTEAGDGAQALGNLTQENFADQVADPAVNGRLQRNATALRYYNGTKVVSLGDDEAAATPSLRSLGTGALQAATGNHAHTLNQNAQREEKSAENTTLFHTHGYNQTIDDAEVTLVNNLAVFSAGANGVIIVGTCSGANELASSIVVTLRLYYNDVLQASAAVTFSARPGAGQAPSQHWSVHFVKSAPQSGDTADLRIITDTASAQWRLLGWSLRVVEIDEAPA